MTPEVSVGQLGDRLPVRASGCLASFLAVGAVVIGLSSAHDREQASVSIVLAAALLAFVASTARRGASVQERVFLPIALACVALPVALAAMIDAQWPLQKIRWPLSFPDVLPVMYWLLYAALVPAALWAGRAAARRVTVRHAALLKRAARMATAAAGGLLLLTALGARRPEPGGYVDGMRVLGTLPRLHASPDHRLRQQVGDIHALRLQQTCGIALARGAEAIEHPNMLDAGPASNGFDSCDALVVRTDEQRHVLVLESEDGERVAYDAEDPSGGPVPLLSLLHGALRPHAGFPMLAAIGLAVALATLLRRRKSDLPLEDGSCREAFLDEDGLLTFQDGTPPLPPPDGVAVPSGPVVAILHASLGSFREHAGLRVIRVVPGTLAEHRLARLAPSAFALAFAVLAAAPLAAALLVLG